MRRARLRVQEQARVRPGEGAQQEPRQVPLETGGRYGPAGAGQQHELLRFQAAGSEGERVEGGAVQPLRVVGRHQQRLFVGQFGQQGEYGDPGEQGIGRRGLVGEPERAAQRLGLTGRQAHHAVQHRAQQLVQPGERQVPLRLAAGGRQHPHPRRPGLARGLGQQDGLAQTRIAQEQQNVALLVGRGDQLPQQGQLLPPPDQVRVLAGQLLAGHLLAGHRGNATLTSCAVRLRIPDGHRTAQGRVYGCCALRCPL